MKKLFLYVLLSLHCMYSVQGVEEKKVAILPVSEIPEPLSPEEIKHINVLTKRIERQSNIIEKEENYSMAGGDDLKLLSIFRKQEKLLLFSGDGGKIFMQYPLPQIAALAVAQFVAMSFKRVSHKEGIEDQLLMEFILQRHILPDKKIKLQFIPETQTWVYNDKQEAFHVASEAVYSYEDLISEQHLTVCR